MILNCAFLTFWWPLKPAFMTTESVSENKKVTWGFNGHMDYPIDIMLLFYGMEKMIGDD